MAENPPPDAGIPKHGGRRAGAGGRTKEQREANGDSIADYNKAKAKNELYKAHMAELEFNIKAGQYVERAAVIEAAATAYATAVQALRSIPDNLERQFGLSPAMAEQVGIHIDDVLNQLAGTFEGFHQEASSD